MVNNLGDCRVTDAPVAWQSVGRGNVCIIPFSNLISKRGLANHCINKPSDSNIILTGTDVAEATAC